MRTLILLVLLSHTVAPAYAQTARPADARLVDRINQYLAPFEKGELSGTLLVARGDRVLLERSFGYAHRELRVPFTPATPTAVASITKPLTIIIASRLADAGTVSPNDTVARWLPEYVHGKRMTLMQLLNHRAGVPHRLVTDSQQTEPRTAADMVHFANAQPLLFDPGTQSTYSSGGYALVAAILERASGRSYDELLQEHVAAPVGARTIRHASQQEVLPGRAASFLPAGDVVLNAPLRDLSFLVGGGSVYTTPRDVHKVMQGLLRGVYGETARSALLRPNGLRWNGITNGYRAFADWHHTDSTTVIFFGNAHTGAIDLLRRAIPRLAAGDAVTPATVPQFASVALPDAARARLEGQYETGGGSLTPLHFVSARLALFGDRVLAATSDTTFFSFADYAPITFVSGDDGTVAAIEWGAGTWGTGEKGPRFARARK